MLLCHAFIYFAIIMRVPERVVYKIAVLTFKVLHWIAPEHLRPVVRVADLPGRQSLRSAWLCHR